MYDYGYGYGYDYGYESTANALEGGLAIFGAFLFVIWIFIIAFAVFTIICNWKVYKKAGKEGWATLIPIYNVIVLLEIAKLPLWYIILLLVPFANIYAVIKMYLELARKFGKSDGFAVGLIFFNPIFMAILAFSKEAKYVGNLSEQQMNQQSVNSMPMYQQSPSMANQNVAAEQSVSTPAFCPNCGNKLDPGTRFCANCGKQL